MITIKLKRDIKTTPEWVFPAVYIRAGEVVQAFKASNLPYDNAVWIDDPRTCNTYGSYLLPDECVVQS